MVEQFYALKILLEIINIIAVIDDLIELKEARMSSEFLKDF